MTDDKRPSRLVEPCECREGCDHDADPGRGLCRDCLRAGHEAAPVDKEASVSVTEQTYEPSYTYLDEPPIVPEWVVCDHCGALIGDRVMHDEWHDALSQKGSSDG